MEGLITENLLITGKYLQHCCIAYTATAVDKYYLCLLNCSMLEWVNAQCFNG